MSGLDVAASIIAVASLGIKLTKALHDFHNSLKNVREDIEDFAFEITTFSGALKELAKNLEEKNSVYSEDGLRLAKSIGDRTGRLLRQIRYSLPGKGRTGNISTVQSLKWHFMKGRVAYLGDRLQALKLNLSILLQSMYAGRIILKAR